MIKIAIDSHDFQSVIDQFAKSLSDAAEANHRASVASNKMYEANDKVYALRDRLGKYEDAAGNPLPQRDPITNCHKLTGEQMNAKLTELLKLATLKDERGNVNRIGCIKIFRELSGCGLKEAKDAFEAAIPPAPYWADKVG